MAYVPPVSTSPLPTSNQQANIPVFDPANGSQWIWNSTFNYYVSPQPIHFQSNFPANTTINATANYDANTIGIYLPTFTNYAVGNTEVSYIPRYLLEYLSLEIKSGANIDSSNYYDLIPYIADLPQSGIVNLNVTPLRINTIALATTKRYNWNAINYLLPVGKSLIGLAATRTMVLVTPTIVAWRMIARTRLVDI